MLLKHFKYRYQAPEPGDDGATGSAAPPADPPPPPPANTFSKEDVDAREAKMRRAYERKMRELEASHAKALADLEAKIETSSPTQPPSDGEGAGQLEIAQKRWERERQELQGKIESLNSNFEKEKQNRLNLQKERLLDDALASVGVSKENLMVARRYFEPDIQWDELDQEWMYRTNKGHMVPILDGVEEFIPDTLRPPKIARGGAGTQAGVPARVQRAQRELEQEKARLAELKNAVQKNPRDNSLLANWTTQKHKVAQMERNLSNSTK